MCVCVCVCVVIKGLIVHNTYAEAAALVLGGREDRKYFTRVTLQLIHPCGFHLTYVEVYAYLNQQLTNFYLTWNRKLHIDINKHWGC